MEAQTRQRAAAGLWAALENVSIAVGELCHGRLLMLRSVVASILIRAARVAASCNFIRERDVSLFYVPPGAPPPPPFNPLAPYGLKMGYYPEPAGPGRTVESMPIFRSLKPASTLTVTAMRLPGGGFTLPTSTNFALLFTGERMPKGIYAPCISCGCPHRIL